MIILGSLSLTIACATTSRTIVYRPIAPVCKPSIDRYIQHLNTHNDLPKEIFTHDILDMLECIEKFRASLNADVIGE